MKDAAGHEIKVGDRVIGVHPQGDANVGSGHVIGFTTLDLLGSRRRCAMIDWNCSITGRRCIATLPIRMLRVVEGGHVTL